MSEEEEIQLTLEEKEDELGLIAVEDIKIEKGMTTDQIMRQMSKSGGFTSQKLADATDIMEMMEKDKDCFKILSFPACLMATGTRGVLVDMVKNKRCDLVMTTCGCLDHDISRTFERYYKGDFIMDDAKLRDDYGISRLGNVLVPDDCYGEVLEGEILPLLDEILEGRDSITTHELIWEIGKRIDTDNKEDSLLYWAAKNQIPIVVPGISDGSFGCQIWMYYQTHRKFRIDLFGDEQMLSELTNHAEKTGALMIGGGISKHHVIWWNQFRGGLDYAVYLTSAMEYDGSLSGARLREAVSWGKVRPKAKMMTVEGDATINLPFIYAALLERL